jgi:hypothetical protein
MGSPCTAKTPWKGTTRPGRGLDPIGAMARFSLGLMHQRRLETLLCGDMSRSRRRRIRSKVYSSSSAEKRLNRPIRRSDSTTTLVARSDRID